LLSENLVNYTPPENKDSLVFEGWHSLCKKYEPVLFEKSPHHLHYWSALDLMNQCQTRLPEIEFFFIGLIRNPMDTIYSMWRSWRLIPEKRQFEWLRAYQNLVKFKEIAGGRPRVFRYENFI